MQAQSTSSKRVPYASAAEALRFKGKSEVKRINAVAWPCGCKPYTDILTRGRWNALGRYIRAGESALHRAGKRANVPVFCRCQLTESTEHMAGVDFNMAEVPF